MREEEMQDGCRFPVGFIKQDSLLYQDGNMVTCYHKDFAFDATV